MRAIGPVEHGQQREGAGGIEDLPGHIAMRLFVGEPGDHRAVVVLPLRDGNPGILARWRAAAFGGDHQAGLEPGSVGQRRADAVLAAGAGDDLGARMPGYERLVARRLEQREPQFAVGEHPPQRAFVRLGREIDPPRLHLIGHRDRGDRAAEGFEPVFQPDVAEQPPARGADRRGAAVETFRSEIRRIGAVDDMAREPLARGSQRERHAHEPAAQDEQVALGVLQCGAGRIGHGVRRPLVARSSPSP